MLFKDASRHEIFNVCVHGAFNGSVGGALGSTNGSGGSWELSVITPVLCTGQLCPAFPVCNVERTWKPQVYAPWSGLVFGL